MHSAEVTRKITIPCIMTQQEMDHEEKIALQEIFSSFISSTYKIHKHKADHIVSLAYKYEKPDFPKAIDILSVIGIESSFDENVKSKLKVDPAKGLTQIRPKVWKHLLLKDNLDTPESQIKYSAKILNSYYKQIKNQEGALRAYNIGLTNYINGINKPAQIRYYQKYQKKRMVFDNIKFDKS